MKQGSRIILATLTAAALGVAATAFAHGGDRAGSRMHSAEGRPMDAETDHAKRHGEHGMAHARMGDHMGQHMAHAPMAHCMSHGMAADAPKSKAKPETDETHKH